MVTAPLIDCLISTFALSDNRELSLHLVIYAIYSFYIFDAILDRGDAIYYATH